MAKVNGMFQDAEEREVQEAYKKYLDNNDPADALSEDDFYEYYHEMKQARTRDTE